MSSPSRALMAVVALLLAIAACGGDERSATRLEDERTPEQIVADFDLASSALLTIEDLPAGWEGAPVQRTLNQRLFSCLDLEATDAARNDQAEATARFTLGEADLVSLVNVYPTPEYAMAALEPVHDPDAGDCYRTVTRDAVSGDLPAGGDLEIGGSVAELDDLGDEGAALHLTTRLTVQGQERVTMIDVSVIRIGRVLVSVQSTGVGTPVDPTLVDQLLRASVARAASI